MENFNIIIIYKNKYKLKNWSGIYLTFKFNVLIIEFTKHSININDKHLVEVIFELHLNI